MTDSNGFGPLATNATTTRPTAAGDTYGNQTWFKDATDCNTSDGTVLDASWLNHILANLRYLCVQGGIAMNNQQDADTWVYDAIQQIANSTATTAVAASTPSLTLGELSNVLDVGIAGQTLVKQADGSWAVGTINPSVTISQGTVI